MVCSGTPVLIEMAESVSPDFTTYVRLRLDPRTVRVVGLVVGFACCRLSPPVDGSSSLRVLSTTA
jgi:hypothetical protein